MKHHLLMNAGNIKISKKRLALPLAIVILAMVVLLAMYFAGLFAMPSAIGFSNGTQYVMYIGTNDKDSYEQVVPPDEARAIVNEICGRYVDGYTASVAEGGWVDERGILTKETTLVYVLTGASERSALAIMDEVLIALRQNSILIEKRDVTSAFYSGRGPLS